MKNVTLQDIRKMDTDNNLPASPAETCQVCRSLVQEEKNERLAIARRLCEPFRFHRHLRQKRRSLRPGWKAKNGQTQAEMYRWRTSESRRKRQRHTLSPVFVDIPESGWVLNDDVYMAKVYKNIRWR